MQDSVEIISETYKFVAGDEVGKLADFLPFSSDPVFIWIQILIQTFKDCPFELYLKI